SVTDDSSGRLGEPVVWAACRVDGAGRAAQRGSGAQSADRLGQRLLREQAARAVVVRVSADGQDLGGRADQAYPGPGPVQRRGDIARIGVPDGVGGLGEQLVDLAVVLLALARLAAAAA